MTPSSKNAPHLSETRIASSASQVSTTSSSYEFRAWEEPLYIVPSNASTDPTIPRNPEKSGK